MSDNSPQLLVRVARDADLDRIVTIHEAAFPDPRDRETRHRNFRENPRGGFDRCHVIERGSELVGHAFMFNMRQFFFGEAVLMAGIASVGIAPEMRGLGAGTTLMRELVRQAYAEGAAFSLLYPFSHAFYEKVGYGVVGQLHRFRVAPRSLPRAPDGDPISLRRAQSPTDHASIVRTYEHACSASHGLISRTQKLWDRFLQRDRRQIFIASENGRDVGYVLYDYVDTHAGFEIEVCEIVGSALAKRAVFAHLRRQEVQCKAVRINAAAGDPLLYSLIEPRTPENDGRMHGYSDAGTIHAGPMLRIVDIARAFASRHCVSHAHGRLTARIHDDIIAANNGTFEFAFSASNIAVSRSSKAPDVELNISVLAQICAGTLSFNDACNYGKARAHSPAAIAHADEQLRTSQNFLCLDEF